MTIIEKGHGLDGIPVFEVDGDGNICPVCQEEIIHNSKKHQEGISAHFAHAFIQWACQSWEDPYISERRSLLYYTETCTHSFRDKSGVSGGRGGCTTDWEPSNNPNQE